MHGSRIRGSPFRHSPKELTRWQDGTNGADVLLHTILLIDRGSD